MTLLLLSVVFLSWYFPTKEGSVIPFYYALWLGCIGIPLWAWRSQLTKAGRELLPRATTRFLVLAYGMVVAEEIIAGFVHAAQEGLSLTPFATRAAQFSLFNLFAMSGLITAWTLLYRCYEYSQRESLFIIGIWGLYAERIINTLWFSPFSFLFFALPTAFSYALIMAPSIATANTSGRKRLPAIIRYALGLFLPFLLSIPFMLILNQVRSTHPGAFPPCEFIDCD